MVLTQRELGVRWSFPWMAPSLVAWCAALRYPASGARCCLVAMGHRGDLNGSDSSVCCTFSADVCGDH